MKQAKFAVSGHFLENPLEEWAEIWYADVSRPPSELIRFWSLPRLGGAFDLRLAVSVPLPIVMGIFVLLWFQSRLT